MHCTDCDKPDPRFHYKEVINGKVVVVDLCRACAVKRGLLDDADGQINVPAVLEKLSADFASLSGSPPDSDSSSVQEGHALVCPNCGVDSRGIKESGRLGCPQCYRVFGELLSPSLTAMHRGGRHIGLAAAAASDSPPTVAAGEMVGVRLPQLKEDLARAVATEAYEKAAELRDLIAQFRCD